MDVVELTFSFVRKTLSISKTAIYDRGNEEDIDYFLAAEVYNLFIVATIICLFIWFFRIAVRERHIRELSSHLAKNNALVFDTLGTDVDILRQFTPEHLMKYLEYNSGCEPIPIELIAIPFALNRDSLSISSGENNSIMMNFKVDATSKFRMQLFWSVPSSVYKKCCKDMGRMICEKDPTFRREFMNPFLDPREVNTSLQFTDVLRSLQTNSQNGYTNPIETEGFQSFHYLIPERLLSELPNYHLDGHSLAIFSESTTRSSIRRMSSQTNLLQPVPRSTIFSSFPINETLGVSKVPTKHTSDILPLIIVLWNEKESEKESPSSHQHSNQQFSFKSRPSELLKEPQNQTEEKKPFVVKLRNERGRSIDKNGKKDDHPSFVNVSIVHFLRNHTPTLIRRLNICPDGVFIPRSIYSSNGDNQKNNECIICFSNPNDVVLLPCRHKLVCRFCVCMIKRCPLCRSAINYYLTEGEEKELGHSYNAESLL